MARAKTAKTAEVEPIEDTEESVVHAASSKVERIRAVKAATKRWREVVSEVLVDSPARKAALAKNESAHEIACDAIEKS